MKLTRSAYEKLIEEDIQWLRKMPRTLEREHIEVVLRVSPDREYRDDRGLDLLREMAGEDCSYRDECPPEARHYVCQRCKAKRALNESR